MKLQNFETFISEGKNSMTINNFSSAFIEFYYFLKDNKKYMDDDTIKHIQTALSSLDKAWKNESETHGVNFTNVKVF